MAIVYRPPFEEVELEYAPGKDHYGHPRSREKHRNAFFDDMHSLIAASRRASSSQATSKR